MRHRLLTALLMVMLLPSLVNAGGPADQMAFGVRAGAWTIDNKLDFEQYEFFAQHSLPWQWHWSSDRMLDTWLDASVGTLHAAGSTATLISLGPNAILHTGLSPISFEGGIQIGWLSTSQFGNEDLGCSTEFLSHLGIDLRLNRRWEVGYRIEHISNGGLDAHNPGLNLQLLQLRYRQG